FSRSGSTRTRRIGAASSRIGWRAVSSRLSSINSRRRSPICRRRPSGTSNNPLSRGTADPSDIRVIRSGREPPSSRRPIIKAGKGGIAMSTDDLKVVDIMIRNAWYKAGFSEEFETEVLRREVICEKVLVFWRTAEGEVVAFDDRCCHKRMPISAGRFLEGGIVECPYHGLAFNSEGQCVKIPSAPDAPIPKRARLLPYKVIEQDGVVWVWPGDAEKIGNI